MHPASLRPTEDRSSVGGLDGTRGRLRRMPKESNAAFSCHYGVHIMSFLIKAFGRMTGELCQMPDATTIRTWKIDEHAVALSNLREERLPTTDERRRPQPIQYLAAEFGGESKSGVTWSGPSAAG